MCSRTTLVSHVFHCFDAKEINQRYDSVEEFRNNFMLCEKFRQNLKFIQDLPRIIGRITLPFISGGEINGSPTFNILGSLEEQNIILILFKLFPTGKKEF